jgi:hypothetical protein
VSSWMICILDRERLRPAAKSELGVKDYCGPGRETFYAQEDYGTNEKDRGAER